MIYIDDSHEHNIGWCRILLYIYTSIEYIKRYEDKYRKCRHFVDSAISPNGLCVFKINNGQ